MKKISLFIIILIAAFSSLKAQSIFTAYSINVEPKDEQTVLQLYKNYYGNKENLFKGMTISLYQNHFKGKDDATHKVSFSGTPEVMGAAYDSKGSDAWALFNSELSKYTKDVSADMGKTISYFGDTSNVSYPVSDIYLANIKDENLYKSKFDAFFSKYAAPNTRIAFGSFSTIRSDGATHFILISYKDFTTKFNYHIPNAIGYKEFQNSVKDIRTFTSSNTRYLLGRW